METISRTNIEWCKNNDGSFGYAWNPVHGCTRKPLCPYCYANKMHKRFCEPVNFSTPHWHESNYEKEFPKKPSIIFADSMSDIEFWDDIWIRKVINKIKQYPQHKFVFLTKDLECKVYRSYNFPPNCYLGLTLTGEENIDKITLDWQNPILNIEPMFRVPDVEFFQFARLKQIICGFRTGRKNIVVPSVKDAEAVIEMAKFIRTPLFIKDNVYRHYPDLPRIQERI